MPELPMGTLRLDPSGQVWHFAYATCGHTQAFSRDAWLASAKLAEREVRWHYHRCLTCQLDQHLAER
jgi:hypothetical protein